VNPLGLVANPLVCIIIGFLFYAIFLMSRALVRRLTRAQSAPKSGAD
jgi:hypothetical protein